MRIKVFAFIWFAALAIAPITLSADDGCCDTPTAACCDKPAMACCDKPAASEKAAPAQAEMACCNKGEGHDHAMPCGGDCGMPCCQGGGSEENAIDVLIAMDGKAILPVTVTENPAKRTAVVYFHRPVWVGRTVLLGKYVIEHDTDRQARGEPCTHIYAVENSKTPVVVFHCTHLEGQRAEKDVVVLESSPDGTQKFLKFQFAGEDAAHGYPAR